MNKYEPLIQASFYNMMFVNDLVTSLLIEADEKMRHSTLYCHANKQRWRKVMDELRQYERMFNRVVGTQYADFVATANDLFVEQTAPALTTLHYCIKQVFDNHRLPQSSLYAHVELARTMVHFSTAQYKHWQQQLFSIPKEHNIAAVGLLVAGRKVIDTRINYFSLAILQQKIDTFCQLFYQVEKQIDLTADANCKAAVAAMLRKLQDPSLTLQISMHQDEQSKSA